MNYIYSCKNWNVHKYLNVNTENSKAEIMDFFLIIYAQITVQYFDKETQ